MVYSEWMSMSLAILFIGPALHPELETRAEDGHWFWVWRLYVRASMPAIGQLFANILPTFFHFLPLFANFLKLFSWFFKKISNLLPTYFWPFLYFLPTFSELFKTFLPT